jgi:hypothetical protein
VAYDLSFSWDAAAKTLRFIIDGPGEDPSLTVSNDFDSGVSPNAAYVGVNCPLGGWNALEISLRDSLTTGLVGLRDLDLDGWSLGDLDHGTLSDVAAVPGFKFWRVEGFDFNQSFTLKGELLVRGFMTTADQSNPELLKADLQLKCVAPAQ